MLSDEVRALNLYDLTNGVHEQIADGVALLEQRIEKLERIVHAFDIEGLKSWADTIVREWKRGERDYTAVKVAEKVLAGLALAQQEEA